MIGLKSMIVENKENDPRRISADLWNRSVISHSVTPTMDLGKAGSLSRVRVPGRQFRVGDRALSAKEDPASSEQRGAASLG